MTITLQAAKALITAARACGAQFHQPLTIAVVDGGGYVILLEREDGARPLAPSIATSKAYSAAIMQRPSRTLKGMAETQPAFFAQLSRMGLHPVVPVDGGMPIARGGQLMGGIGVTGASPGQDQEICDTALEQCGYARDFGA